MDEPYLSPKMGEPDAQPDTFLNILSMENSKTEGEIGNGPVSCEDPECGPEIDETFAQPTPDIHSKENSKNSR